MRAAEVHVADPVLLEALSFFVDDDDHNAHHYAHQQQAQQVGYHHGRGVLDQRASTIADVNPDSLVAAGRCCCCCTAVEAPPSHGESTTSCSVLMPISPRSQTPAKTAHSTPTSARTPFLMGTKVRSFVLFCSLRASDVLNMCRLLCNTGRGTSSSSRMKSRRSRVDCSSATPKWGCPTSTATKKMTTLEVVPPGRHVHCDSMCGASRARNTRLAQPA